MSSLCTHTRPLKKVPLRTAVLHLEQPCFVPASGIQPELLHYLSRYLNGAREGFFCFCTSLAALAVTGVTFLFVFFPLLPLFSMRLLITLPCWKRKLIPLDGILWMRRWPVATAEETDVCSQCRKSGEEDFLEAVEREGVNRRRRWRRRKRRQRSGQPSYHWNRTSKRSHERHRCLWQRATSAEVVGRDPALTSRWHWTAAADSSQSVQVRQAAEQAVSWGHTIVAAVHSSTPASTSHILEKR